MINSDINMTDRREARTTIAMKTDNNGRRFVNLARSYVLPRYSCLEAVICRCTRTTREAKKCVCVCVLLLPRERVARKGRRKRNAEERGGRRGTREGKGNV